MRLLLKLPVIGAVSLPLHGRENVSRDAHGQLDFAGRLFDSVKDADVVPSTNTRPRKGRRARNSRRYLWVVTDEHFDARRTDFTADFWRFQTNPLDKGNTQLLKIEHSVLVARGARYLAIAN